MAMNLSEIISHAARLREVEMNLSKINRLAARVREKVDCELRILCVEARECASLGAALTEKERKALLIFRDGLRCQGCGWKPPYEDHLEVDHMEPRSLGGTDEIENRELLCGPCNKLKSNKLTLTELQEQRIEDGSMDMDWWDEYPRSWHLNTGHIAFGDVNLPEFALPVRVRSLTGPQRCILWRQRWSMFTGHKPSGLRMYQHGGVYATALAFAMVDEGGNRVFTNDDIPDLGKVEARILERVYRTILRLSMPPREFKGISQSAKSRRRPL